MIDFVAQSLGCQCCIPNGERHHAVETVKRPGRQAGLPWHMGSDAMVASQQLRSPEAEEFCNWHVQQKPIENERLFHSEDPSHSLSADSNMLDKSMQAESPSAEQSAALGAAEFVMEGMDAEVAEERCAPERNVQDPSEELMLEVARNWLLEVRARHSVEKSAKDALDMQQMRFILEANAEDARKSMLEANANRGDEMPAEVLKPLAALEVIAPPITNLSRIGAFSREPLTKLPDNMLVDFLAEQTGAVLLKNTEIVELVAEGVDSIEEAMLVESCNQSLREPSPPSTKTPATCSASAKSQAQVECHDVATTPMVEPCQAKANNMMEALVTRASVRVETAVEPNYGMFVRESLRAEPISDNLSELWNPTNSKPKTKIRDKPDVPENACKTLKPITRMPVETFDIALRVPIAAQPVSMTIATTPDDLDLLVEESFV